MDELAAIMEGIKYRDNNNMHGKAFTAVLPKNIGIADAINGGYFKTIIECNTYDEAAQLADRLNMVVLNLGMREAMKIIMQSMRESTGTPIAYP